MHIKKLQEYYSHNRIESYIALCSNDHDASKLYDLNIALSLYFFELISHLELVLRNKLHLALSKHYNDNKWYVNDKFITTYPNLYKHIHYKITKNNPNIDITSLDHNIVISRLSFGVYTDITQKTNILHLNKKEINNLYLIKRIRDRYSHHESLVKDIYNKKHQIQNIHLETLSIIDKIGDNQCLVDIKQQISARYNKKFKLVFMDIYRECTNIMQKKMVANHG